MSSNMKLHKIIIKEILGWVQAIIFAIIISLLIRAFIFETVYVDGSSMESTLKTGNRLVLYKLGYFFSPPKKGDIVVLQVNEGTFRFLPFLNKLPFAKRTIHTLGETDYIKRVIAVPGDEVDIKEGFVYINNIKQNELYVEEGTTYRRSVDFPLIVEENKVFVLGDNRQNSRDSREIGLVDFDKIKGKAIFRIWPLKCFGKIY